MKPGHPGFCCCCWEVFDHWFSSTNCKQSVQIFCFMSWFSLVVVQLLNCVWPFVTPWTAFCQASLSFMVSWSLPKFMSMKSAMLSWKIVYLQDFVHFFFWSWPVCWSILFIVTPYDSWSFSGVSCTFSFYISD